MRWQKSVIREHLIKIQRQWYRITGNWIKEGWCNCQLAGIDSLRNIK